MLIKLFNINNVPFANRKRYSRLKNEEDSTETQKIKLEAIKETCPNLTKMYELIETSSVSTSQWSKVILSYEGIPEFPAFESYGDELLPPRELDVILNPVLKS